MHDSYYPKHAGEQSATSEELHIAWLEDRIEVLEKERDKLRQELESTTDLLAMQGKLLAEIGAKPAEQRACEFEMQAAIARQELEQARDKIVEVARLQREACANVAAAVFNDSVKAGVIRHMMLVVGKDEEP